MKVVRIALSCGVTLLLGLGVLYPLKLAPEFAALRVRRVAGDKWNNFQPGERLIWVKDGSAWGYVRRANGREYFALPGEIWGPYDRILEARVARVGVTPGWVFSCLLKNRYFIVSNGRANGPFDDLWGLTFSKDGGC